MQYINKLVTFLNGNYICKSVLIKKYYEAMEKTDLWKNSIVIKIKMQ